jgi:hypothetical protein
MQNLVTIVQKLMKLVHPSNSFIPEVGYFACFILSTRLNAHDQDNQVKYSVSVSGFV